MGSVSQPEGRWGIRRKEQTEHTGEKHSSIHPSIYSTTLYGARQLSHLEQTERTSMEVCADGSQGPWKRMGMSRETRAGPNWRDWPMTSKGPHSHPAKRKPVPSASPIAFPWALYPAGCLVLSPCFSFHGEEYGALRPGKAGGKTP